MKTRTLRLLFLVGLLLISVLAHSTRPSKAVGTRTVGCCGTQPVTLSYGQKQLFIPNVFTPNGDGFNDYFLPFTNDHSLLIRDFIILSAQGDSILFSKPRIDYSTMVNKAPYGWNGRRKDGTTYQGRFIYRMRIDNPDAHPKLIEGTGCALLGSPGLTVVRSSEGCLYVQ